MPVKRGPPEREWKDPKLPTDEEFKEVCREFGITSGKAREVRALLACVVEAAGEMRAARREHERAAVIRRDFEAQAKKLGKVIEELRRFDKYSAFKRRAGSEYYAHPEAIAALKKAASENLSRLLDPWFVCDWVGAVPSDISLQLGDVRSANFNYERGRAFVNRVVESNSDAIVVIALEALRKTFVDAADTLRAKARRGGPDRYEIAPWVLMNFAEIYHRLGRAPQEDDGVPFGHFAVSLVEAIGWPTLWVNTYLKKAITNWLEKYQKS